MVNQFMETRQSEEYVSCKLQVELGNEVFSLYPVQNVASDAVWQGLGSTRSVVCAMCVCAA